MKFTIALIASVAAFAEASQFKSGAVTGFEKFTYGKFITRMKAPNKKGTVASFFTYWNGPNFYPGGWNELDVEIVPTVSDNPMSMNVIYGDGEHKRESHDYKPGFDPKDEWHIYEIAWTPDFIAWSIDNKEVRRITQTDPAVKLTVKPQSVMMNFWTPTFESWGKGLDAKDMPWEVTYDYVETYTYNTRTKGFDFHWRDEFNTFDTNRWHKSDNTTFDANSTTFRASQSFIKDGALVLKMEPDRLEDVHGVHRYELPTVQPVQTEPTAHAYPKGKKEDEHFDVDAAQHHSQMRRAHDYGYMPHGGYPGYAPPMYGSPYGPYPAYGQQFGYGYHPDPFHAPGFSQSGHDFADHHDFYSHEHEKPAASKSEQGPAPSKGAKANFAAGDELGEEVTPFEFAHSDQQAHFDVPHHGAYSADHDSYTTAHVDAGHHGDFYGDGYHGEHAYASHATVAAPLHDDWVTAYNPHGHDIVSEMPHTYDLNDHHGHHVETDPDYNHDINYHDGHRLMGQIEHEYDQLFHELEHRTKHGVEHHDVQFVDRTLVDHNIDDPHHHDKHVHDFQAVTDQDAHWMAGHADGFGYGDAHHGDYVAPAHGDYYHGDDYWYGEHSAPVHHGDHVVHEGEHHGNVHHGDFVHGDDGHDLHETQDPDYNHDINYHDGHKLMGQIEHEYDELFHELEARTEHGVEHHDISFVESTIVDHEHDDPQHHDKHIHDFQAVPYHDGHYGGHHNEHYDDAHHDDHYTGHADYTHGYHHGDYYASTHHGDYHHAAPVHAAAHHSAPVHHEAPKHEKKAKSEDKKDAKPAAEKPAEETKEVTKKLYYSEPAQHHGYIHRMLSQ